MGLGAGTRTVRTKLLELHDGEEVVGRSAAAPDIFQSLEPNRGPDGTTKRIPT